MHGLHAHVSDPVSMRVRPEALLDPAYLAERARLIAPERAATPVAGSPRTPSFAFPPRRVAAVS